MPRTTSQPILLVSCPDCCQFHLQQYWGSCEDHGNRYANADEYVARHPEAATQVEVLEFA